MEHEELNKNQQCLLKAVRDNDLQLVINIVKKRGCNPNFHTSNIHDYSPLYVAAQNDNIEILKWLVEEGGVEIEQSQASYFATVGYYSASRFIAHKLQNSKK